MNKQELVSVIIPTHNRAHILPRTIKSVLSQTYQNIELIIVDDASTDNTEQIVRSFSDSRVQYIRHTENKGCAAGRNTGIRASKGDFVAFLDSDDEYLPDKVERSLDIFRTTSDRIGMVASNYFVFVGSGKTIGNKDTKNPRRIFPHVSSWIMRRMVFERVGLFDERIFLSEEVDFFHRFRKLLSFRFIDKPLLNVYQSADGFFSDPEKYIRLRKQYLEKLRKDRRLYACHLKYLGKDLHAIGKEQEARECFLKAFCIYPINLGYLIKFIGSYFNRR